MGLFNKIFNGSDEPTQPDTTPWVALENIGQLDDIVEKSKTKPQLLFKHSTRCGISRMVIKQFQSDYELAENEVDLYYLDLLNHRDISNDIANRFDVMHESPQLLVIKNGVAVAYANHGGINDLVLEEMVK